MWKGRWVALYAGAGRGERVGRPIRHLPLRGAQGGADRGAAGGLRGRFDELIDDLIAELQGTLALLHPAVGPNYLLSILAVLGTMALPIWGARLVGAEFRHRTAKVRAAHVGWGAMVAAKVAWLLLLSAGLARSSPGSAP